MNIIRSVFIKWLPFAVVITCFSVIVYATVQQTYRQSANDPQIQLAEDIAYALTTGASPELFNQKTRTDIARSLAPFVIVYNSTGDAVAATGMLHNDIPSPPDGVLRHAGIYGENRLTWQPEPSVRIATVVKKYSGGFVLAGRSLREVEKRVWSFGLRIGAAWFATLVATFAVMLVLEAYELFKNLSRRIFKKRVVRKVKEKSA